MRKTEKPPVRPFFIAELAHVAGGGPLRGRRTTIITPSGSEDGIGTTRMTGEEGPPPGGGFDE